jgi:mannose/fructose-specific phosphotransferase system component IIA
MKGVILISHGRMAEGMADSAKLFVGDEIPQFGYVCLEEGESPDTFKEELMAKMEEVNQGDGVLILAELYGGTPCNQAATLMGKDCDLIAGVNFGMLLQILLGRETEELDLTALMETGRGAVVNVKEAFQKMDIEDDWL